jgi:hypothetical protein
MLWRAKLRTHASGLIERIPLAVTVGRDLGVGFYDTRLNAERAQRNHVRQLEALGYTVILEPAA